MFYAPSKWWTLAIYREKRQTFLIIRRQIQTDVCGVMIWKMVWYSVCAFVVDNNVDRFKYVTIVADDVYAKAFT